MTMVRAAALVAASVMSIGVASAPVAVKEVAALPASPPGAASAQRQVADPAVAQLAAEKGLSMSEAQRRLDVQQQAPKLDEALAGALRPARYGGVWIGDDDRIKVGILQPDTRFAVQAAATAQQLAGEIDLVPVRHSLESLRDANNWLADQIIRANINAASAMVTGHTTAGNSVQVGLPPETVGMTPSQRAVLDEAHQRYGSMLSTYTLAGPSSPDIAECEKDVDSELTCDMPLRGGIRINADVAEDDPFCTLGFLARGRSDNKLYGITAGHCLDDKPTGTRWYTRDTSGLRIELGPQRTFRYPGDGDAGIIEITDPELRDLFTACACSWVAVLISPDTTANERYTILRDGVGSAVDHTRVCHTGTVSGTGCGRVQRLDQTSQSGVRGLVEADYCGAVHGDSGGPVYSGNTAYGLHQSSPTYCSSLYQPIRRAEDLLNVDVVFDRAPVPGTARFRHNKNELSPLQYNFYRPGGQRCQYRIRYGDFAFVAYAQIRFYAQGGACLVSAVEVFGQNFSGVWAETLQAVPSQRDECGAYIEVQATSPSGHSAAGMAVVTPDGNRIFYSHTYTDLGSNSDGTACP